MLNYEMLILISIFAWVFTNILIEPDMIFGKYPILLEKYIKKDFLMKPLGMCSYCFGGQIALWYSLFNYESIHVLIFNVVCVILTIKILNLLNNY